MLGLTTALASVVIVPVKAASADTPASTAAVERKFTLNIPAQKLSSALVALSNATGTQLAYTTQLSDGLRSSTISGTMSVNAALAQILSGTGLTYRFNGNTVVLTKASANITLGPVRVGGTLARQDPTGPGVGYVADSTTSGTKTDTPLMEIPNSIYVVTKQQMVDQQPQNIQEALRYSPGVYSEAMGNFSVGSALGSGGEIMQRGFSTTQFVDGLMSNSMAAGETSFLERVEAINGPASVMYGQTAPGGLIAMSLKKPTDTPLHQVSVGFGNWNRYEATFDVSDKVTKSGNIRYRIAGIGVTQDTQTNYTPYKRVGILPSITWDIDPKTSLTLIGSYSYTPDEGQNLSGQYPPRGSLITDGYQRISRSTFLGLTNWNKQSYRDAMFEYQFSHKFNKYINFSQNFRYENNSSNTKDSYWDGAVSTDSPDYQYFTPEIRKNSVKSVVFDTRLYGKFNIDGIHNTWVVGSDFRNYHVNDINYTSNTDYVTNIYDPQATIYSPCLSLAKDSSCSQGGSNYTYSYFQEGIYFQDQIKWKHLSILIGGRQDWFNETYNGTSTYSVGTNQYQPHAQSAFTWRGGVIYNTDFGLAPYFSYSTSFQPQNSTNWQGQLFAPLQGKQLEAGLKYKVPNRDIMLTAAAFHIDENHYLISDLVHEGYSEDAGRVKSQGFEVSANANITKNLRAIASYSYTDIRFAKDNLTDSIRNPYTGTAGATVSESGKVVPQVPRNMFSVFVDYTIPSSVIKGLGINWGMRYVGYTYATNVESFKTPSYILFDIGAHYDLGAATPILRGLKAQLSMSNLTNKYYITACGNNSCYLGQGRRVYGNLTYNW
ncbi:TonB-dependent siderophore receptor [Acetobacter syzygii]|nr:TonB-dependent siderophore receptor [Acetobacter syzygii]